MVPTLMMMLVTLVLLRIGRGRRRWWLSGTVAAAVLGVMLSHWWHPVGYALSGTAILSALVYSNRGRSLDRGDVWLALPGIALLLCALVLFHLHGPWRTASVVAQVAGCALMLGWVALSLRTNRRFLREMRQMAAVGGENRPDEETTAR